jgi:PBP1b-binding outer membrane lipoprotein LpoB
MKKFFALLAAVVLFTACNNGTGTEASTTDSTAVDSTVVDTTTVECLAVDSTVVAE